MCVYSGGVGEAHQTHVSIAAAQHTAGARGRLCCWLLSDSKPQRGRCLSASGNERVMNG